MLFNSLDFVFFFLLVYGLYLVLRRRGQNILLLLASLFFYGCWDYRFLALILTSITTDYFCALGIGAASTEALRKRYVALSAVINLGILFFFKYYGFFGDSLNRLLSLFGSGVNLNVLRFILPVGISFYTFQSMSYTVDVYRGHLKPTRNFADLALFVTFFPQLVAGPIERGSHLLPQVQRPRVVTHSYVREGAWLVLLGFYKKVVVADNLAVFVDEVFNAPAQAHGFAIPAALLAFAFQIYGDFAGYSDIARGTARLMGFDILYNFKMPYFAVNPSDFWRRWHISLSSWLRDYLYIPLGGNRHGTFMVYRNLLLTMFLGGLWHGAAWHYVFWGMYQGLILVIHRALLKPLERLWKLSRIPPAAERLINTAFFFAVTCGGWLLFRVNQMSDIPILARNVFRPFAWNGRVTLLTLLVYAAPLVLLDLAQERSRDMMVGKRWPAAARALCYAATLAAIFLSGAVEVREFIYFQF